jgi:hypothetical protein
VINRVTDFRLAITFCNNIKKYLSPFSKWPKGTGAGSLHANSVKLERNFLRCTINFRQFAKRAKITFGAAAKGNLFYPLQWVEKVSRLYLIL